MPAEMTTVLKDRLLTALDDSAAIIAIGTDIATEIQRGTAKLYVLVEELGSFVTNTDVSLREKGISLLSAVLSNLPKDFLNETELKFITTFYCDRLKDHHSIIPAALKGILAIVQMNHLPHDSPSCLFRVLSEHVPCQSQLLSDRHNIYLTFKTLLEERIDNLKSMGPDFVYGVISAIDGERDPRNLILLFSILPHFIKSFPLGHLTEEMFEVIACYFPVDFNPTISEGLTITREDLAEKLAPCLIAIPEFAEFCVPLINDKLFSSLKVAKLDSLKLLCNGAPVFGSRGLEPHVTELWTSLRSEIMPGSDVELRNAGLTALRIVIEAISDKPSLRESFIDKIITDAKSSLCDVQLSLFRPAVGMLQTVAAVNKESCVQVLRVVIPLCLGQYSTKTSNTDKILLVETLNSFLKICADHGFDVKSVPELSWTDIPQLYSSELSTKDAELKSNILFGLSVQKACLNEVHRGVLYDTFYKEIENGSEQTRVACHGCILSLALLYPEEVTRFIKERLLLCYDDLTTDAQVHRLEALAAIAKMRALSTEALPQLMSQSHSSNFEISFTALVCLYKLVSTKNLDFDIQHYLFIECNIIEKLISLSIDFTDPRMNLISNICRLIIRSLTIAEQHAIVKKYSHVLNQKSLDSTALLVMNILIPLRRNVSYALTPDLVNELYEFSTKSSSIDVRNTTYKFMAVALNKTEDEMLLSHLKEKIIVDLASNLDCGRKKAIVTFHVWLTKAAVTKGSHDAENLLNYLTEILKSDSLGQHVAQEYKILASKNEDALTIENYCNIRFLYKQRIFEHLLQKDSSFSNSSKENYLTALIQLLEEVPVELLFMKLQKLVPLLLESLSLNNEQLLFSTLQTLKLLLDTKNPIFSDKIQSFIPRLLKLLSYETMRVRIATLECLTNYCYYPVVIINTYKQDILEKLVPTLDDRKRLVRKAAAKARTKWFLVGAPGGITGQ